MTGTATDDIGVASVAMRIFDDDAKRWLQPDGSLSSRPIPFNAVVANAGAASTTWSFDFSPPKASTYFFYVHALDSAEQVSFQTLFASGCIYPGDAQPTVTVNLPTANQTITTNRIALSGSANDDTSVTTVEALYRNVQTGDYLRIDGSLGAAQWVPAALTNPGGDRTNFDYQTPILADGTWDLIVRSEDNSGQTAAQVVRLRVTLS